jgi:hypothetical protein
MLNDGNFEDRDWALFGLAADAIQMMESFFEPSNTKFGKSAKVSCITGLMQIYLGEFFFNAEYDLTDENVVKELEHLEEILWQNKIAISKNLTEELIKKIFGQLIYIGGAYRSIRSLEKRESLRKLFEEFLNKPKVFGKIFHEFNFFFSKGESEFLSQERKIRIMEKIKEFNETFFISRQDSA